MQVFNKLTSSNFGDRASLGSLNEVSGVSIPYIGLIYPDKDVWFKDEAADILNDHYSYRESLNDNSDPTFSKTTALEWFPSAHKYGSIQSQLCSMDTQRIPAALAGGANEIGIWGFDLATRRNVLRRAKSLEQVLWRYIKKSTFGVAQQSGNLALSMLGATHKDIQNKEKIGDYGFTDNDLAPSFILQNSTTFLYVELAYALELRSFLTEYAPIQPTELHLLLIKIDESTDKIIDRYKKITSTPRYLPSETL